MGHFLLNVDPDLVRETKRHYTKIARALREEQRKVKKTPGEIGDDWIGQAAITVKVDMTALGTMLDDFADDFDDAATALETLAKAYDQGLSDVKELNSKYTKAETNYDDTTKAIQKMDHPNRFFSEEARNTKNNAMSGLSGDYDEVVERMRTATRKAATALHNATYVKVDPGTEKQLASPNGFTTALAAVNDSAEEGIGDKLSLVSMHDALDDTDKIRDANKLAEDFPKYWQLDEDDREKFISTLAKNMNDPEFAGMFAKQVTPSSWPRCCPISRPRPTIASGASSPSLHRT